MKRTLLTRLPVDIPSEIASFIGNSTVYDSSCSPEARVYFIDKDGGYYLKRSAKGSLEKEAQMTAYFHFKGLSAQVLSYLSSDSDWLLTARIAGEDCTHELYLSDPNRLCDIMAHSLRLLHETDFSGCPVTERMKDYLALADENYRTGNYDSSQFPDSFGYASAKSAYAALQDGRQGLKNEVLIHGDFCLPNIMLDNWQFSGFIDLGNGGVGDRHIDLFWGAWTLGFNLGTDKYRDRFFDAYGRDKIDRELLATVAAAEVFG